MQLRQELLARRRQRIRAKLRLGRDDRYRMTVHRTNMHIYVQIIDDKKSVTLASASSLTAEFKTKTKFKNGGNKEAAHVVGEMIAKRALDKGIKDVFLDRSGYLYHGRIKELAEAARQGGLNF